MNFWDRWHRELSLGLGFAALICVLRAGPDGSQETSAMSVYYLFVAAMLTYFAVRLYRRHEHPW